MIPISYRPALLAGAIIVLSGCSTFLPESCEQFEERRKQTNYATEYHFDSAKLPADAKPLDKKDMAAVRGYELRLNSDSVRPCSHVKIKKELVLLRRDNAALVFEETREFFSENGTRIAVKTEVLTDQLKQSGRYSASVPLPIPKNAPPGKYRLTSTLVLKTKGSAKPVTLAKSTASFEVTAIKK